MIYPTAIDCLKSIEFTLESKIKPALSGAMERSALATAGHLLRHVMCRIEREGEVLSEDIRALRALLAELHTYAAQARGSTSIAQQIQQVLGRIFRPADTYLGLATLAEEAGALREALAMAQSWLIQEAGQREEDPEYRQLRAKIRAYIAQQLTGEALLIEPAFLGHGARR